jgi:hypothetical protein
MGQNGSQGVKSDLVRPKKISTLNPPFFEVPSRFVRGSPKKIDDGRIKVDFNPDEGAFYPSF